MKFVQRNLLKAKKIGVTKVVSSHSANMCFLQMFLINWQMEGTNSNYRSVKFEEISPKKTEDIHV